MASFHISAPATHSISAVHRLSSTPVVGFFFLGNSTSTPTLYLRRSPFRCKKEAKLHVKGRWLPVFASNNNRPEESSESKTSNPAAGPPLLTILAGFFVFFGLCWLIGSIFIWVFRLIAHPPVH